MPQFSVIIPTFNRRDLVARTLKSVLAQSFTDFETIVVDDGSTDSTIEDLKKLDGGIRIVCQQNRGPGAARNVGALHAKGEYFAFIDSDDVWFSWTLDVYRRIIATENAPCFIAGKPHRFWNENELQHVVQENIRTERFRDYLASGDEWRWWGVSSFVIRRDAFLEVGGFTDEPVNGEDADLALRLGLAKRFVQVKSPVTFGYREHANSVMKEFQRSLAGVWHKVRAEQGQCYPGGSTRARERWRILTRHIRPVTLDCLRQAAWREGWDLYLATFVWNLGLGRWKYVIGFPILAVVTRVRKCRGLVRP